MSASRTRTRLAILMVATGIASCVGASSTAPAGASSHHASHCRPRAGEHVRRRFARLTVLENRREKAIACVRATGHRESMIGGRHRDDIEFLSGIRRTAGTIIAYDVALDAYDSQTRVLDAATGDRVVLGSNESSEGKFAVRVLLKRDGTLATTIGTYSIISGGPNPSDVKVVICDVAHCRSLVDHVATYGADIDPASLRREGDQACWTRNTPMRAPVKECVPLSAD